MTGNQNQVRSRPDERSPRLRSSHFVRNQRHNRAGLRADREADRYRPSQRDWVKVAFACANVMGRTLPSTNAMFITLLEWRKSRLRQALGAGFVKSGEARDQP